MFFFFISNFTLLYKYAKHNREGGRKNRRTTLQAQPRGWKKEQTNKRSKDKKEKDYVTLLCRFLSICRLSLACIWRETSRKPQGMLTHLCLLLLIVLPLDSYLKPTVLLCPALSTALSVFSRTFLPSSTSVLAGDLALSPLCGFRAKTDKEIVWVAPTQTETNRYASCHIIFYKANTSITAQSNSIFSVSFFFIISIKQANLMIKEIGGLDMTKQEHIKSKNNHVHFNLSMFLLNFTSISIQEKIVYVFTNQSATRRMWHKVILKQSKACSNSGCLPK